MFTVSAPRQLAAGYRPYERYQVTLTGDDGAPLTQTRDLIRGGLVVAVLPVDLGRDEVVLIRQFRLAAHLANGLGGLLEIVAGRVEDGEAAAAAAHRECVEEIGVAPAQLVELFRYLHHARRHRRRDRSSISAWSMPPVCRRTQAPRTSRKTRVRCA